jgi:hypothetical protein
MAKKKAGGRGGARPGAGRKVGPEGPAVMVSVSLPKSLADALDAYVEAGGVSKSAAVADALRVWLKRRKR